MVLTSSIGIEYFELYGVLQVVWGSMCSCTECYEVVSPLIEQTRSSVTITRCTDWYEIYFLLEAQTLRTTPKN